MSRPVKRECLQCGAPVKHTDSDGKLPRGSAWMMFVDKDSLFCTMRCAARYGIAAAHKFDIRAGVRRALAQQEEEAP